MQPRGGAVGIECAIARGVVGFHLVGHIFERLPPHGFTPLEQNLHIDVVTVYLQHLLFGRHALGVDVVDEEVVAIEFDAAARCVQDVVALDVVEQHLEPRMKRLDTGGIL